MAGLDKLVKVLETLKWIHTSGPQDALTKEKEKAELCVSVAALVSANADDSSAGSFPPLLSHSVEALLTLTGDPSPHIRLLAAESLDRVIRSAMHGHLLKVQVELYKEIKKNGSARPLRAALSRFGHLAHLIRPQKGRPFIQGLVPCLISISKRTADEVQETLAEALPKIFSELGTFATDALIKSMVQGLLNNVTSSSSVTRRTAVTCLVAVCDCTLKSQVFLGYTLSSLLELTSTCEGESSASGLLAAIGAIAPRLAEAPLGGELSGSFGRRAARRPPPLPLDALLHGYELCLEWSGSADSNTATAALDALYRLLGGAPSLTTALAAPGALVRRPRTTSHRPIGPAKALSEMSLVSCCDESVSLVDGEEPPPPLVELAAWLADSKDEHMKSTSEEPSISAPFLSQDDMGDWKSPREDSIPKHEEVEETRTTPTPPPSPPGHEASRQSIKWDWFDLVAMSGLEVTARYLEAKISQPLRVSMKCSALNCLAQLYFLQPSLVDNPGSLDILKELCDDGDPQVRGLAVVAVGNLLASSLIQCYPLSDVSSLVHLIAKGMGDESSQCVKHSLGGCEMALSLLLESSFHPEAAPLLAGILLAARNPYWLVKVKVVTLLSNLPYCCIHYSTGNEIFQTQIINHVLLPLLGDSDVRVRRATADTFLKLVGKLYYSTDVFGRDVIVARAYNISRQMTSIPSVSGEKHTKRKQVRDNLSRILYLLVGQLVQTPSKHLIEGCLLCLSQLCEKYEVSDYPDAWQCTVFPSGQDPRFSCGLISICVYLVTSSPLSLDLNCQSWLLNICGRLLQGLSTWKKMVSEDDSAAKALDPALGKASTLLWQHCLRLAAILSSCLSGGDTRSDASPLRKKFNRPPSPPVTTPATPTIVPGTAAATATTPGYPVSTEKENSKEEAAKPLGHFHNIPHYMKLYDIFRSAFNNYKMTVESGREATGKLLGAVATMLECSKRLLDCNAATSSAPVTRELLSYLSRIFIIDSTLTVALVNQLLKCLLVLPADTKRVEAPSLVQLKEDGLYNSLIGTPSKDLMLFLQSTSQQHREVDKEVETEPKPPTSTLHKSVLALHIKLFEPIVIQALKEYTVTNNVKLQVEVLSLLMSLVQLKVNYCLLDSDQIFIKFILKQFEYLEAGQVRDSDKLIEQIFEFLVHLSNEKNHSKPVISVPKVIHLCDGLMASGQDPNTHCIPALAPLVQHILLGNGAGCDPAELDTQREVVLAMLLKLAEFPQVLELLVRVMKDSSKRGEQWKKNNRQYRQTVDSVIKGLEDGTVRPTGSVLVLYSLLNSSPAPPLSHLLQLLFTPQRERVPMADWLACLTSTLMSLASYKEELLLVQVDRLNIYLKEEGDDPLNVNNKSKQQPPHHLMAKLLLRIVASVAAEIKNQAKLKTNTENVTSLQSHYCMFLLSLIHILQPGMYEDVKSNLEELVDSEAYQITTDLLESCLQYGCNPYPIILWSCVMALLSHGSTKTWNILFHPLKSASGKLSLNALLIKKSSLLMYCDYLALSGSVGNGESCEWLKQFCQELVEMSGEPPIERLFSVIYCSEPASAALLSALSGRSLGISSSQYGHKLLHALEFVHCTHTSTVLKLVALKLIPNSNIAIGRLSAAFASRMVEYLLTQDGEVIRKQISKEDLLSLLKTCSSDEQVKLRCGSLVSLLQKLASQVYGPIDTPVSGYCHSPIDVNDVATTELDRSWLISTIACRCCSSGNRVENAIQCAHLLETLQSDEIMTIMKKPGFNLFILQHCFSLSTHSFLRNETSILPPLYIAARDQLIATIEPLFGQSDVDMRRSDIMPLVAGVTCYLSSIPDFTLRSMNFNDILPTHLVQPLAAFALLCVQGIIGITEESNSAKVLTLLAECAATALGVQAVMSVLSLCDVGLVCNAAMSLIEFSTLSSVILPQGTEDDGSEDTILVKINSLVTWLEERQSKPAPTLIDLCVRQMIICISGRSNSSLESHECLRAAVKRRVTAGWVGRHQYEESWVSLLSALVVDPQPPDPVSAAQANATVLDGLTWLVMSTQRIDLTDTKCREYFSVPRLSPTPLYDVKGWKRLREVNDAICWCLKRIGHKREAVNLTRVDERQNIDAPNYGYGFGQLSVEYLIYQITPSEERTEFNPDVIDKYSAAEKRLAESGVDVMSCVQFILDLCTQWIAAGGMSLYVEVAMLRALCWVSDLFTDRAHYVWLLEILLETGKRHPQFDLVMHQYITVGICKAAAVINVQESEVLEKVLKTVEWALKSWFSPLREAGLHGLLYLLQGIHYFKGTGDTSGSEGNLLVQFQIQSMTRTEFNSRILALATCYTTKHFNSSIEEGEECGALVGLAVYLVEQWSSLSGIPELGQTVKTLSALARRASDTGHHETYYKLLQSLERLVLVRPECKSQAARLALERMSQTNPRITLPALQLLLASLYTEVPERVDSSPGDKLPWSVEQMENTSALFDRLKKAYPEEVDAVASVVPTLLADLFSASDILTKVIAEFLSPNHPHRKHMADIVHKVFRQACSEQQLPLLQEWVVHFIHSFTTTGPTVVWSLTCFFIAASNHPHLYALFPHVQSRMTKCDYEDRRLLCLAALNFYNQLSDAQKEVFVSKLSATGQSGPFSDLIFCLTHAHSL